MLSQNEERGISCSDKTFFLKKLTAARIEPELEDVHGDTAPTLKIVYFWINEFKRDRTTTKDEAHPGRPIEVTAPEMIENILCIVMEDREIKMREIDEIAEISVRVVHNILHEKLEMKNMCARWVL